MTTTVVTVPSLTGLTGQLIDSRLGSMHRSGHEPLRRALNTIPEWVELVRRLNALEALRLPAPPAQDTAIVELATWLDEATRGDDLPDIEAAVQQAHRVQEATTARGLLVRAFRQTAGDLATLLDQVAADHAEHIHRHLTGELRAVVERAREVAEGFGLTADDAIRLGKVDEYQAASEMAREYAAFRTVRNTLDAAFGWPTGPDMPVVYPESRWLANPADPEVFEHWRQWRRGGYLVNPRNRRQRLPLSPPWPQGKQLPHEEADAWLGFLVSCPSAVPWLPSRDDYLDATRALMEYASRDQQTQAHDDAQPPALPAWLDPQPRPAHRTNRKASR